MKIFDDFSLELSSRFSIARWAPIPLRLIVGYGFIEHGFAKLSKGANAFAGILQAMGVPDPHLLARLTILTELLGGFAVILGAFVAIASVPMAAVLLVAMFTVHLPYGFSSIKLVAVTASGAKFGPPGYEVDLLYIACLAALVLGGSGPFAVDRLISNAVSNRLRHAKFVAPRDSQAAGFVGRELPITKQALTFIARLRLHSIEERSQVGLKRLFCGRLSIRREPVAAIMGIGKRHGLNGIQTST